MDYKFVTEALPGIEIDLAVLRQNTHPYSTLLLQHSDVLEASEYRFGNIEDRSELFRSFLDIAITENVDLILTPEYSCPRKIIEEVIKTESLRPQNDKLWVLGCESMTLDELNGLKAIAIIDNHIILHFDETIFSQHGNFVNPLCYIFNAKCDQDEKLIILIQFKNNPMGSWSSFPFEEQFMLKGKEIYIFKHKDHIRNSISLFSLVCSDAYNFLTSEFEAKSERNWETETTAVILNPQCNPEPNHEYFRKFQDLVVTTKKKDLISLNWGYGSSEPESPPFIICSRSSIHFNTDDAHMKFGNEDIFIENHKKGLYFFSKRRSRHIYFLNPKLYGILYMIQKPHVDGDANSPSPKNGIQGIKYFSKNGQQLIEETTEFDDGFNNFLSEHNCLTNALIDTKLTVIDKERLINLTLPKKPESLHFEQLIPWSRIDKLQTLFVDVTGSLNRITAPIDSDKQVLLEYFRDLKIIRETILKNEDLFPSNFKVFLGNCKDVMFPNIGDTDKFNYDSNLVSTDDEHEALVSYIGVAEKSIAINIYNKLVKHLNPNASKRIVVWYQDTDGEIHIGNNMAHVKESERVAKLVKTNPDSYRRRKKK